MGMESREVEIKKLFHFLQNKIYYLEGKIMSLIKKFASHKKELEDIGDEIQKIVSSINDGNSNVLICFHNHYDTLVFSIFEAGNANEDVINVSLDGVLFLVGRSIKEEHSNYMIENVLNKLRG